MLNAVLGGGMSSRLFQEIREKRGLAYSTYSFASAHGGLGTFGLYAGCAAAKADQVTDLLVEELEKLANDGITEAELKRSVGQLSGGTVLGLEDSGSRMSRLGKAELVYGDLLSLAESLERIQAGHGGRRPGPGRRPGRPPALDRPRGPVRQLTPLSAGYLSNRALRSDK